MTEGFGTVEIWVVYWRDGSFPDPAEFVGRTVRFEGNLVYQVDTGYETLRFYQCPEGFRVHENDDRIGNEDGSHELYPARGEECPPEEYGCTLRRRSSLRGGPGWPAPSRSGAGRFRRPGRPGRL